MKLEFRQFTIEDVIATKDKWLQEADRYETFPDEVNRRLDPILEQARSNVPPAKGNTTIYYGVFKEGEKIANAYCEMVLSDKGAKAETWLKLLKIFVSPEIESLQMQNDTGANTAALSAYIKAVLGSLDVQPEHKADKLKIYARSAEQLTFINTVFSVLQQNENSLITATIEGRWLVVCTKQKSNA